MESNDPHGVALRYGVLNGWEHWEMLCQCTGSLHMSHDGCRDLQLRIASQALARIMAEAKTNPPKAFIANRYLLGAAG
jgi:hypothetical protein